MKPEQPVLDRRSLAYRLDLVLNLRQIMCLRGSDNSPRTHRRGQAIMALNVAADLGSRLSVDELVALREGEQLDADPRELALIAQAMDVPEWVLTQTPPEGKRVVLARTRAGANRAALLSDDGDPSGALTPEAERELAAWLREQAPQQDGERQREEEDGDQIERQDTAAVTPPARGTCPDPRHLPPAVQYLLSLPPAEVDVPQRWWSWRRWWPGHH